MIEYLDQVIKADQRGQVVHDIGTVTKVANRKVDEILTILARIREAELKLTWAKFHFGAKQNLGKTLTRAGVALQSPMISILIVRNKKS